MDWIGKIKDLLDLGAKQVFIVFLAAWVLLLLPNSVVETMGLVGLRNQYRPLVGVVALVATAWLAALLSYDAGAWVRKRFRFSRTSRRLLENLSPVEKGYLKRYMANKTQTATFSLSDGVAQGLVTKRILYLPSDLSRDEDYFDYNLHSWAYKMLKENSWLLSGAVRRREDDDDDL
jgi:superinfection exclusion protein B